jgi:predicted DNA binding protein
MHELGHAHYGHTGVTGKQEALANRWAAYRLIDFGDLISLASVEQSSSGIAAALEVMPDVLETYLQLLTRSQLEALRSAALHRVA